MHPQIQYHWRSIFIKFLLIHKRIEYFALTLITCNEISILRKIPEKGDEVSYLPDEDEGLLTILFEGFRDRNKNRFNFNWVRTPPRQITSTEEIEQSFRLNWAMAPPRLSSSTARIEYWQAMLHLVSLIRAYWKTSISLKFHKNLSFSKEFSTK